MSEVTLAKVINAAGAVELIRQQVEKHGEEFVYEKSLFGCKYLSYNENSTPVGVGCLIGQIMINGGFKTHAELEEWDDKGDSRASVVLRSDGRFTMGARYVFRIAQAAQDGGKNWGTCLKEAEAYARDRYPNEI